MQVLDAEGASRFLAVAREDRLYAMYVLAISTGLRQGELLGLQWSNVDLQAGNLSVLYSLFEYGGKFKLSEPKSSKSRRLVTLPDIAIEALFSDN